MIISIEELLFPQILLLQPDTFTRVSVQMNWTVCTDAPDRIKKVWVNCPSKDHVPLCGQNEDRKS